MKRANLVSGAIYKHKDIPQFFSIDEDKHLLFLGEDALKLRFDCTAYHLEEITENEIRFSAIRTPHLVSVDMFLILDNYITVPKKIELFSDYAYFLHGCFVPETCSLRDTTIEMLMELSARTGLSVSEHADEIHSIVKELITSLEEDAVTEKKDTREDGNC